MTGTGLVVMIAVFVGAAIYHLLTGGVSAAITAVRRRRRVRHHLVAMREHIERNAANRCGACGQPLGVHTAEVLPLVPFGPTAGAYAKCPARPSVEVVMADDPMPPTTTRPN